MLVRPTNASSVRTRAKPAPLYCWAEVADFWDDEGHDRKVGNNPERLRDRLAVADRKPERRSRTDCEHGCAEMDWLLRRRCENDLAADYGHDYARLGEVFNTGGEYVLRQHGEVSFFAAF